MQNNRTQRILLTVLAVIVICIIALVLMMRSSGEQTTQPPATSAPAAPAGETVVHDTEEQDIVVQRTIEDVPPPVMDFKDVDDKGKPLRQLMEERKKALGLDKSLDMIVRSDETIKIGEHRVAMRDILEKAFIDKGRVFEEQIGDSGQIQPEKLKEYGIYVVQPGDNIWNIHFNILKEYYQSKDIRLDPSADEPREDGSSTGIGKILKFSETMVIIYNLIDKEIQTNIDLIQPLSKIVVYNMEEVFSLLEEINYKNVNRIQFDGKTIWIPANES